MPRSPSANDIKPTQLARYLSSLTNTLIDHFMRIAEKVNISLRIDGKNAMTAPLPLFATDLAGLAAYPAADYEGSVVYLLDGAGGIPLAVSNGTDWVYPDGSAV